MNPYIATKVPLYYDIKYGEVAITPVKNADVTQTHVCARKHLWHFGGFCNNSTVAIIRLPTLQKHMFTRKQPRHFGGISNNTS
jgi:hypothetical protein